MYDDVKQQFKDIEKQLIDPAVINDVKKLTAISRKHAELKDAYAMILEIEKNESALSQNKEITKKESDEELVDMAKEEIAVLEKKIDELKSNLDKELNPADPRDKKSAIIEIRAGTGGDESALFSSDLFRMYSRFGEVKGWKINLLNTNRIGIGGLKEIIFEIKGKGVFGVMKYEAGTHRVQRVPETEKQGRIHTSAVTVAVLPEAEEIDLEIRQEDIRIDTYASSA